jgi:hypothetical protein
LHDAVIGERLGTPSIAVITTAFVDAADRMAEALGFPGYGFAIVSHPISSADREDLAVQADQAVRQAEKLLHLPDR